jgi:hypothetical protein
MGPLTTIVLGLVVAGGLFTLVACALALEEISRKMDQQVAALIRIAKALERYLEEE